MAEVTGIVGGVGNGNHTFRPNTRVWAGGYAPDPGPAQFLAASNYPVGTLVYLEDTLLNAGAVYRADVVKPANVLFDPADWTIVGRYWRADEPFLTSTGTVTANSSTIITNQLQSGAANGGTQIFIDTDIQWAVTGGATAGGGNANNSRTLRRSNIILDRTAYTLLGNWSSRTTLPTWVLDDFTMSGLVDEATASVGASIFTGAINANSSFNNVNFWNGIDLGDGARGGVWQTTTGQIYNNSLLGPFGNRLNNTSTSRMIARFANQGNTALTQAAHTGLATNYDFRSISQIDASVGIATSDWFIDIDTGGHIAFLNWLPGEATGVNNWGFTNIFNGTAGVGGQAHVLVGTNQQAGAGDHIYTVTDADIDNGMLLLDGGWDVNTSLTNAAGVNSNVWLADGTRILTNPTGALVWRNQHFNHAATNTNSGDNAAGVAARLVAITDLSSKSYRKYSWLQQPDETTWGREITVSVPPNGATDPQVATARAGGYDEFNGTTWETSTDISDPVDIITSQTALNTPAKAQAIFNAAGAGGTHASHVVAGAKWIAREGVTDANVGATNTLVPLDYTISGTTVNFSVPLAIGSGVTTAKGVGGYTVKSSSITLDDAFLSHIDATVITLTGTTVNDTDTKAILDATALGEALVGTNITINTLEAHATNGNINFTGSNISNSQLTAAGTFAAGSLTDCQVTSTGDVTITGNLDDATITTQGTLTFPGNNNLVSPCNLTANAFTSLQSTPATRETFVGHTINGNFTFVTSNPTLDNVTWAGGAPTFIIDTDVDNAVIISSNTDLSAVVSSLQNGAVQYRLINGATVASAFGGTVPTGWVDVSFNSILPAGDLATIRSLGGVWDVVDLTTGNSVISGPVSITSTTTMAQIEARRQSAVPSTTIYKAYYKPANTFGGSGQAYALNIVEFGALTENQTVQVVEHSSLITTAGLAAGPLPANAVDTEILEVAGVQTLIVELLGVGNTLSGAQTQAASFTAANTVDYVRAHILNPTWDDELFVPGPQNASDWTSQSVGIRFDSGDALGTQQIVAQLNGTAPGGQPVTVVTNLLGATFREVLSMQEGNATIGTVQTAITQIVGEELTDILENQVAVVDNQGILATNQQRLQITAQRGAVKAAVYSAPAVDTDTINSTDNTFNNPEA